MEAYLSKYLDPRRNIIIPNASWGLGVHECDLLAISVAGYATEIEIKISRADLRADVKKHHDHKSQKIKFLYFAVPSELARDVLLDTNIYEKPAHGWHGAQQRGLLPPQAGVLIVASTGRVFCARKAAANSGAEPFDAKAWQKFARLMTLRYWDQHHTISGLRHEVDGLREVAKKFIERNSGEKV